MHGAVKQRQCRREDRAKNRKIERNAYVGLPFEGGRILA